MHQSTLLLSKFRCLNNNSLASFAVCYDAIYNWNFYFVVQVLVEVLSAFMEKADLLTLEICYMLIPLLNGLLSSDNDR